MKRSNSLPRIAVIQRTPRKLVLSIGGVIILVGALLLYYTIIRPYMYIRGPWSNASIPAGKNNEATPVTVNTIPIAGPLYVNPDNPRYFTDGTKENGHYKAIYLTGSHTWCNFLDCGSTNPPPAFDYGKYLDFLVAHHHNFIRLWRAENARGGEEDAQWWFSPMPYVRSSECCAFDGGNKFDLTKFNQAYFDRLRQRVVDAGNRGIYVSIMLFDGWSIESQIPGHEPWPGHPYNVNNNINGINGDLNNDGQGGETHTLQNGSTIMNLQESYVRKVIDTVNDLNNVLYEISNEDYAGGNSQPWQYHMIDFIKTYEATKAKQHPVGLSTQRFCNQDPTLPGSPANWIAPCFNFSTPPLGTGAKVLMDDSDHPLGPKDRQWIWKSFTRGLNPLFMDPYDGQATERGAPVDYDPNNAKDVNIRDNMGYTALYSRRIDLADTVPHPELCSTSYCLANPIPHNAEYLVYLPVGDNISKILNRFGLYRNPLVYLPSDHTATVDLSAAVGELTVEWFNPLTGDIVIGTSVSGGTSRSFTSPFPNDAVLYIHDPNLK